MRKDYLSWYQGFNWIHINVEMTQNELTQNLYVVAAIALAAAAGEAVVVVVAAGTVTSAADEAIPLVPGPRLGLVELVAVASATLAGSPGSPPAHKG